MAQAMASMAGSLQLSGSTRLKKSGNSRMVVARPGLVVRAQQVSAETETSRRAMLGLVAGGLAAGSFVNEVLAAAQSIKVGPPPPPSGGLPGTLNSDEPRDFDKPLKERFFLQPLPPPAAVARAKDSAKEILNVKEFIDKKAWPYVQMDLRNKAGYLRYDLNTIISSKSKEEKKSLKDLTDKLYQVIGDLDYAAKVKSTPKAEKSYAETVAALNNVLAKIG